MFDPNETTVPVGFLLQIGLIAVALVFGINCIHAQDLKQVNIAFDSEFSSFNSITSQLLDPSAENLRTLIHNSLVKENERLEYVGELAESVEFSTEGTVVIFELRKNIVFHDGSELTSKDVIYTFDELIKRGGSKAGAFYEAYSTRRTPLIRDLFAIDSHRVKFTVSNVASMKILLAILPGVPIIPVGSMGRQSTNPVGTGPFIFVRSDSSNRSVELKANSKYWEGSPFLHKIFIDVVPDNSVLLSKLTSGSIDIAMADYRSGGDVLKALDEKSAVKVTAYPGTNIEYLGVNTRSRSLRKKEMRQAIAYSIDREKLINEFFSGRARLADSTLPPDSWASSTNKHYTYSPTKARSLLKSAGYKGETISLKVSQGGHFHRLAQSLKTQFSEAGINVSVEPFDPGVLRAHLMLGDFELSLGAWIGGNQDPLFFYDLFSSARIPRENVSCCNRSRYSNETVDALLGRARDTFSKETEKDLYEKASRLIFEDLPLVPLWHPDRLIVSNKRLVGLEPNPDGDWSFLKNLQLEH